MIFYTSDTHFGHSNIIRFCNRPFASVDEMNEKLISNWNSAVGPEDDIYHLGDFAMGSKDAVPAILARLNGRKHLVWGNHDSDQVRALPGWASSQAYLELNDSGKRLVLCHYAMKVWNHSHRGSLMLYGHSHGSLPGDDQSCDVGVDCFGYRPVPISAIGYALGKNKPHSPVDHHEAGT